MRGAVSIALAIALDNSVRSRTVEEDYRALTNKVFGMVGGVAFITLIVNGTLLGPLLNKLGFAKSTEIHKKIIEHYKRHLRKHVLEEFAILLIDPRYSSFSYDLVRNHVTYLRDLSDSEVNHVVEQASLKKSHDEMVSSETRQSLGQKQKASTFDKPTIERTSTFDERELRLLFLDLLRASYEKAVEDGYLDVRVDNGFVYFALSQSLNFAADLVNRGGPIEDWRYAAFSQGEGIKYFIDKISSSVRKTRVFAWRGTKHGMPGTQEQKMERTNVVRAFAFQEAHEYAREKFQSEFAASEDSALAEAAKDILRESQCQEEKAAAVLNAIDKHELEVLVSHFVCIILLNKAKNYIIKHHKSGLIPDTDAHDLLDQVDEMVHDTHTCVMAHTDDEDRRNQYIPICVDYRTFTT